MALLDPTDQHRSDQEQPTARPRLCLAASVAFLVTVALVFHYAYTAIF